jgi:hypothetical protein
VVNPVLRRPPVVELAEVRNCVETFFWKRRGHFRSVECRIEHSPQLLRSRVRAVPLDARSIRLVHRNRDCSSV